MLGIYYARLLERLDSLYALRLPAAANDSGRAEIARWSQDTLEFGFGPILQTYRIGHAVARPINNAALIGVRLYRSNLDLFDDWDRANNGDLTRGVYRLQQLLDGASGDEAFRRMRVALHRPPDPVRGPSGRPDYSSQVTHSRCAGFPGVSVMDQAFVARNQSRLLAELEAFLAIPSISTLPAHAPDCRRAAQWLHRSVAARWGARRRCSKATDIPSCGATVRSFRERRSC